MSGFASLLGAQAVEPTGSGGWVLPAGAYVCKIKRAYAARTMGGKDCVKIEWVVAEGEHADFGNNTMYPPTETIVVDDKTPKTLGFARFKLDTITRSNPGAKVTWTGLDGTTQLVDFDASTMVANSRPDYLDGMLVGFLVGIELYTKSRGEHAGEDGERNIVAKWVTPEDVRRGYTVNDKGEEVALTPPPVKDSRKKPAETPAQVAAVAQAMAEDPIPF